MKIIIAALALLALAAAAPESPPTLQEKPVPQTISSEHIQNPDGAYNFNFKSENGIERTEEGSIKEVLDEKKEAHKVVVVRGSYSYVDPEGKTDTVEYSADENGYKASGPSIPKPVQSSRR